MAGASPWFGRGGGHARISFFSRFGNLHVERRHPAHGKAMCFARGVRGHAPTRSFFKMVQLKCVLVYIWIKFWLKKISNFLYNFFKLPFFIYNFYKLPFFIYNFYKLPFFKYKINILDSRLVWGNSHEEIFWKLLRLISFCVNLEIIFNRKWLFSCINTY